MKNPVKANASSMIAFIRLPLAKYPVGILFVEGRMKDGAAFHRDAPNSSVVIDFWTGFTG
ncbi:MAG: hypothetical protein WCU80_08665 [Paludibacteraceae bacterium]